MLIGILSLQGDFEEHKEILDKLKVKNVFVNTRKDLNKVDALIVPGGESTTIAKLLKETGLGAKIISRAKKGLPVFGTCAGAIVLAKKIIGKNGYSLKLLNATMERNPYGSQQNSFDKKIKTSFGTISVSFIRAPKISALGKNVKVLGKMKNLPVIIREKNILASACHPEIALDTKLHKYFLGMIKS